jgi:hypothetical protein
MDLSTMVADPWADWALGTDGLAARYCELNRIGDWLRQPVNAVTNVAFAFTGVAVLRGGDRGGRLKGAPTVVFGASLLLLALGSGWFHASIALHAQRADMGATYAVVLALIGFAVMLLRPADERRRWLAAVLGADVVFVAFDLFRQGAWLLPVLLFGTLLAGIAVFARMRAELEHRHLALAALALVIGAVSWVLDDRKILCDPTSLFQWHGLWHVAMAFAALELFRYFDRVPVAKVSM